MKKTLVLAASAMAAAGFGAANASAVDVELYGQVNKSVMVYDDGVDTETNIVDNDMSSTRFGLKGSQNLDNGLTASVLFEVEMQSNASNEITQNTTVGAGNTPASTGGTFAERQARVGLGGDWGAVFIGQASTATDSIAEQDLAGAKDVLNSEIHKNVGAIEFRDNTGALSGHRADEVFDNMDGNGRGDAIRYDSPIFNGFQVRVSAAQGGDVDGGVYYHGTVAEDYTVKAAVGYVAFNSAAAVANDTVDGQVSGSVSVKHNSGLGLTAAYGQKFLENETAANDEPSFWYVKAGYTWDNLEVAADYGVYKDMMTTDTTEHEATHVGVAAQLNMGHGTSLAAYYKQLDLDYTGTSTDDINLFGVNLRVKF